MDGQSGETKEEEVTDEGIGELEIQELVPEWDWQTDDGSEFQRQQMKHNEMSDKLFYRGHDVSGRETVTADAERVLRGRWTEMRLCCYGGWVVMLTL